MTPSQHVTREIGTISKANVKNARVCFYSFIIEAGDRPKTTLSPYKGRICNGYWRRGMQHPPPSSPAPLLFLPEEDIIMSKWHEAVGSVPLPAPQGLFFFAPLFPSCFAAGHRPSEAWAWAPTQRDGRSHIIDWTLDKRSRATSSAVWSSNK